MEWILIYFWFSAWNGTVLTQDVQAFPTKEACVVVMEKLKARAGNKTFSCVETAIKTED